MFVYVGVETVKMLSKDLRTFQKVLLRSWSSQGWRQEDLRAPVRNLLKNLLWSWNVNQEEPSSSRSSETGAAQEPGTRNPRNIKNPKNIRNLRNIRSLSEVLRGSLKFSEVLGGSHWFTHTQADQQAAAPFLTHNLRARACVHANTQPWQLLV